MSYLLVSVADQYSLGSRMQVELRSASVIIQMACLPNLYADKIRKPKSTATMFDS
jgi:hypothetical protein